MVALRKLSGLYLAAASAYAAAVMLSHHPLLIRQANRAAVALERGSARAAQALDEKIARPGLRFAIGQAETLSQEWATMAGPAEGGTPHRSVELDLPPANRIAAAIEPQHLASLPARDVREHIAHNFSLHPHRRDLAPPLKTPPAGLSVSEQVVQAEHRLKAGLTPELFANFDLFLYVSKAESGPIAQRMYVFRKEAGGELALLHDWPVSTGRERVEYNSAGRRLPSFTPAGYYELDPDRFFPHYHSSEWNQPMPYAMFFNWVRDGSLTGLAIHSAVGGDIADLGRRASAGCVRLSPEAARTLFTLIRSQYRGQAPRFVIDRTTGTMNNDGILLHDADGKVERTEGYRVLVFIENYGGRNVVAAMF
jgi:hypothetical protein